MLCRLADWQSIRSIAAILPRPIPTLDSVVYNDSTFGQEKQENDKSARISTLLDFFELQKKQLNLRAVRATMPTPHREDKLIGGQMMNYEASPFQDYESITIDELKDQANSLLNLVTDEQRPLRVCMNNGKEFLLFPQDLLAPICDSDFRLILLSAMRYAMGRNTCMPAVVSDYIKRHIRFLDDKFLALAADDIRRHLEDYAEHEPNPNLWQGLFDALETEQRVRATRQARKIRSCPTCGKPSL